VINFVGSHFTYGLIYICQIERVILCEQSFARAISGQRSLQTSVTQFICVIFFESIGFAQTIFYIDYFFECMSEIVIESVFGNSHIVSNKNIGIFTHSMVVNTFLLKFFKRFGPGFEFNGFL